MVRQQAIIWANVYPDLASLDHNKLVDIHIFIVICCGYSVYDEMKLFEKYILAYVELMI